ncbi:MAG: tRNA dihydrouridine synthase DusB [Candidatus Aegiribacteria sp.]|nr:tRNA dihydrouridine synthase DusB [Candidatus Aegiribacteria sp.]MBD3295507.1 tRNA dihydrouridine synthase DusB [Candidatus Fermentibacteria bacterium]
MDKSAFREYTHGTVLAPMAGTTDSAFRLICREMGATAVVTEMVAAAGLSRKSVKSHKLLHFKPAEKPIGVQLFGNRPEDFARAAEIVSGLGFDFIDINAGCPVKKVVTSGSGSALLRDTPLLSALARAAVKETDLPVTVKIRLGWNQEEPVHPQLPKVLADEGVKALAVHGRYRSDMFSGTVRTECIKEIVDRSPIPVVANGDVRSPEGALLLKRRTGASGIMVGRGAMGNPWIFRCLKSGRAEDCIPAPCEVTATIRRQMDLMSRYIPVPHLYHILRGHLLQYIRDFRGASRLRGRASRVDSREDLEDILKVLEKLLKEDREKNE